MTEKEISNNSIMLDQLEELTQSWEERPSWDEYFMATALLMASRSGCERLKVGCVIVSGGEQNNRIVAAGYNGFLPGRLILLESGTGMSRRRFMRSRMRLVMRHGAGFLSRGQRSISLISLVLIARR